MGKREETILLPYPEVVARVILMVMGIDHSFRMELAAKFQESFPAVGESGVDQQPVDKKGMDLVKGKTKKSTGHSNRLHRALWFNVQGKSIHVALFGDHSLNDEMNKLIRLAQSKWVVRTIPTVGEAFK